MPALVVLVGAFLPHQRAALWIPSFSIMGVACLVNARGCGRRHCQVTGPVFLLGAVAIALDSLSVVDVAPALILVGVGAATLFAYGLEAWRGKYVGARVP